MHCQSELLGLIHSMGSLTTNKLTMVSILTSIISLLLVSLVVWVFLSTQEQVQQLQIKLQNMQQSLDYADGLPPEMTQMREHIQRLEEKLRKFEGKKETNTVQQSHIKMITPDSPIQAMKQKPKVKPAPTPRPAHKWLVVIASFDSLKKAKKAQQGKKIAALHSTITMVRLKHGTWYRIVRSGFIDKTSAIAYAKQIKHLGFKDAWVQYRP
ncbi:MAG: SPOR domain-containing protein [Zetaproteobacteria bacterium]|nr:SPOR domain-containing protein [Zetaproteobacteria bacterium]